MSREWQQGWPAQYKRMIRWKSRFNESLDTENGDDIFDFIYAFFQSAYHLRDWMVSDGTATREEMTELFQNSTELQLCRDICNATKHLQYDRPSIDPKPMIAREWDPFNKCVAGYFLYSDKRRPIGDLMIACITVWDDFLDKRGFKNT